MEKYANYIGYSDVYPCEVIREVSDKTLEIRSMDAERDTSWEPITAPGGFMGHTINQQSQRWFITRNAENSVFRIRRRKDGRWYDKHSRRYSLSDEPIRFYDYNF